MAVNAAIKFQQGVTTDLAGRALLGVLTTPVTATNGDNSNVIFWEWEVIDVPPGSAVSLGVVLSGLTQAYLFIPDQRGSYHLKLTTKDFAGNAAVDFRVFGVLETTGRLVVPFEAKASALNFGGQARGWAKYMEQYLHAVDALASGAAIVVQDEGVGIANNPHSTLNFVGASVTASDVGSGVAQITVSASGTAMVSVNSAASPYAVAPSDAYVMVDASSGAVTITLPASPTATEFHYIKDQLGAAPTHNITVNGNGKTIDGAASHVLSTTYGSLSVKYNGSNWSIF